MFDVAFSVRVVYDDGDDERPPTNCSLYVSDCKHAWSTASWEDTTDDDGVAYFEGEWMHGDGKVQVFVNGDDYGVYSVTHGTQVTVHYDFG